VGKGKKRIIVTTQSVLVIVWCGQQQKRHMATLPPGQGAEKNGKKQAETGGSG